MKFRVERKVDAAEPPEGCCRQHQHIQGYCVKTICYMVIISGVWTDLKTMLLPPCLLRPHASSMLSQCVQSLARCHAGRTLHSQTVHFLQRRTLPVHLQGRGNRGHSRKSKSQEQEDTKTRNRTVLTYIAAAGVGMIGLSYASVPLYRLYCQVRTVGECSVQRLHL